MKVAVAALWLQPNTTVEPSASALPAAAEGVPVAVPPERTAWVTESAEPSHVGSGGTTQLCANTRRTAAPQFGFVFVRPKWYFTICAATA